MTVFVSQDAVDIGLKWYPNDPVNLSFRVADVNWAGSYTATVRENSSTSSAVICSLNVTAVYDAVNLYTTFTFTTSTQVPSGSYWWSCKQVGGVTRFSGQVLVDV
jgi:hypothetical protein